MRKYDLAWLLAVFMLCPVSAQADSEPVRSKVSVSTDSLTWAIDGYSVIGSYESSRFSKLRFHVEVFGIELPAAIIDNYPPNTGEGWQRRIEGALMLSVDHHPFTAVKGLHWGAGFNVQRSTISRSGVSESGTYDTFEPIVRLGYQWFPWADSGFFITPYAALGFPFHLTEPPRLGGDVYEEGAILPVGSIQIGWRFPVASQ